MLPLDVSRDLDEILGRMRPDVEEEQTELLIAVEMLDGLPSLS